MLFQRRARAPPHVDCLTPASYFYPCLVGEPDERCRSPDCACSDAGGRHARYPGAAACGLPARRAAAGRGAHRADRPLHRPPRRPQGRNRRRGLARLRPSLPRRNALCGHHGRRLGAQIRESPFAAMDAARAPHARVSLRPPRRQSDDPLPAARRRRRYRAVELSRASRLRAACGNSCRRQPGDPQALGIHPRHVCAPWADDRLGVLAGRNRRGARRGPKPAKPSLASPSTICSSPARLRSAAMSCAPRRTI